MSDLRPDNVGYYGKPVSSLTKDELIKAILELAEIIITCPEKGKCKNVVKPVEQEKTK